MKATLPISLAAVSLIFTACDARVNTNPPVTEKNTTIVNPPAEKKTENNTTIVTPAPTEKKTETTTTITPGGATQEKKETTR